MYGRYSSIAAIIPAPETPKTSSSGGSQQQLEAIIAETSVPAFAIRSPRFDDDDWSSAKFCDAPGNAVPVLLQQSGAGLTWSSASSDIGVFLTLALWSYRITGSNPSA